MGLGISQTFYIDDGEQVYPCRCGTTHRGPYAIYDYGHHNCYHDAPLLPSGQDNINQLLCPRCGEVFSIDEDD